MLAFATALQCACGIESFSILIWRFFSIICDTKALGTQTFTTYLRCVLTCFNEPWFQCFIIWQTFRQKVYCAVCCVYFSTRTKTCPIVWINNLVKRHALVIHMWKEHRGPGVGHAGAINTHILWRRTGSGSVWVKTRHKFTAEVADSLGRQCSRFPRPSQRNQEW